MKKRKKPKPKPVIFVDFLDGDERRTCTKCGRRYHRIPHWPSGMCTICNPLPENWP